MFRLKFAKMYDNTIFKKYNKKPIVEDYYAINKNIFCVADGVTRDSIYGEAIPYPKDQEEVEKWIKEYPNPSGSYEAAKICAETFVKLVAESKEKINENNMKEIVKKVNSEIEKINQYREIDYLANDLYCCVAVGGYIQEDTLYCFSIGDCHISAYDENFNLKFTTINNHKQFEDYLEQYCKENEYNWNNPLDRIMVRKEYRNKPEKKYNNKEVSFGVLSGEEEANYYIDTYKLDLREIKYICAYSDGCEPFFEKDEQVRRILQNPEEIEREGKERTLIIYERI